MCKAVTMTMTESIILYFTTYKARKYTNVGKEIGVYKNQIAQCHWSNLYSIIFVGTPYLSIYFEYNSDLVLNKHFTTNIGLWPDTISPKDVAVYSRMVWIGTV